MATNYNLPKPTAGTPRAGEEVSLMADVSDTIADIDTRLDAVEGAGPGGGGVADGDKGDISVSGGGTVWTIDAGAVDASKVAADVATQAELDAVVAGLSETIDDRVAALLVAGSNVTLTYDDVAGTLTVAAAGGGGATNLTWDAATSTVASDTGTDAVLSAADGTNPGLMTSAQKAKLDGVEAGATADQTAAEILDAVKTVDGAGSGLDADLLDGLNATAFLAASGEYAVNVVAASGATETLTLAPAHRVTMDQSCTFTFPTPTAGHTFLLLLSGAFTPTFPASVDWDSGAAPTYATPSLYGFTTLDGGTTWLGSLIASGLA